jgi:transposase-like protein
VTGDKEPKRKFKTYPIGYFHIDIAEVRTVEGKLHHYEGIDRTSKFAFVQLVTKANRVTASAFLVALIKAVPYKIRTVLTDNGIRTASRSCATSSPMAAMPVTNSTRN